MSAEQWLEPGSVGVATGDGRWRMLALPARGGLLASLQYRRADTGAWQDLLAGPGPDRPGFSNPFFRGVPLYPFPNRLRDGCWRYAGEQLHFPLNEPQRGNALHGFLYRRALQALIVRESLHEAGITLQLDYAGDEAGYPFAAWVELQYHLDSEAGLRFDLMVTNRHAYSVPLGLGWHPYLCLNGIVDSWYLQLPPCECVEVDERMLPVGRLSAMTRFRERERIHDWQVDHCFRLLPTTGQQTTRLWEGAAMDAFGVELWQDASAFPGLQVYIPPDRQSLALEPVSCGIDALNTGEGLRWLEAGECWVASCGLRVMGGR